MADSSSPNFRRGQIYKRLRDIHLPFGGSRQGGVSPSGQSPYIFLFTGESGEKHGYKDEWKDGVFLYSGEGQKGDQTFRAGNKAIRDHAKNGRDILLFTNVKNGVRYEGVFHCAGHHIRAAEDGENQIRDLIIFHLVPDEICDAITLVDANIRLVKPSATLEELRRAAYAAAGPPSKTTSAKESLRSHYKRSEEIRAYVLKRANGKCECCKENAPFNRTDGSPYLENHHIHKISEHGRDDPSRVAAICPTCHRQIHYGENGAKLDNLLSDKILTIEEKIRQQ